MNKKVTNQAELDAAIAAGHTPEIDGDGYYRIHSGNPRIVVVRGQPHVVAWESSQPHVEAWGSSQPHVVARESSQPHVVAWGSSQPHVEAWGSSQPHVEAWGSSQPHVEAAGYVQLSLRGAVTGKAGKDVAVLKHGTKVKLKGGKHTQVVVKTARQWCDYYGVRVKDGVATLYKGLAEDFTASPTHGSFLYKPGTKPVAPDWDGGNQECGRGLHFSPHPKMTLEFRSDAKKFVACPVALKDIAVHPDGTYPQKCKARGCCAPIWECDINGNRIDTK
jgi:hypothetical protein